MSTFSKISFVTPNAMTPNIKLVTDGIFSYEFSYEAHFGANIEISGFILPTVFRNRNGLNPIVPIFDQIQPICSGVTFSLPTTSLNGITGSWLPANNKISTTTYTFTPNPDQNATTTTMTVVVNPTTIPVFTQLGPFYSGDSFSLPTTSLNGISGFWLPAINNTSTTTYMFTPNSGSCATHQTMTITINQSFDYYIYNGKYNSIPISFSNANTQFIVPKSGILKIINVNVSNTSNTLGITLYKNGILFYTTPPTNLNNNLYSVSLYVNVGDILETKQQYISSFTTITLYFQ